MKFFYLRDESRNPIGLVASHKVGEWIEFAISTWNPKDKFDKKIAKEVAVGRLKNNDSYLVRGGEKVKTRIMKVLVDPGYRLMPRKARKAAQLWIDSHTGVI